MCGIQTPLLRLFTIRDKRLNARESHKRTALVIKKLQSEEFSALISILAKAGMCGIQTPLLRLFTIRDKRLNACESHKRTARVIKKLQSEEFSALISILAKAGMCGIQTPLLRLYTIRDKRLNACESHKRTARVIKELQSAKFSHGSVILIFQ